MATTKPKAPTQAWWDRMAAAFTSKDAKAAAQLVKDADGPKGGDDDDEDEDDKATKDDIAEVKKTCDALQKTVDGMPALAGPSKDVRGPVLSVGDQLARQGQHRALVAGDRGEFDLGHHQLGHAGRLGSVDDQIDPGLAQGHVIWVT